LANHYYYQFPDGTYYVPYDIPNQFENLNCWFIIFPLIVYNYASFEFIFSMDTLIYLDIMQYFYGLLNLNYFFDSFFYFVYVDYVGTDIDTINSA
jgi:hypothetical protein